MKKSLTTEEFINKANKIHNKYDYSLVNYLNNNTKVKIICVKHGIFEQTPNSHLSGSGCAKCSKKFLDREFFIEEANKIHNNKYDYSLVNYVNNHIKVKIICIKHGIFEQTPNSHLSGSECAKCCGFNKTTEEFIKEANIIHKNRYKYDNVIYLNAKSKVKIICSKHGTFEQSPNSHLCGNDCPKCAGNFLDKSYFIEKANKIHNNRYCYEKAIFINSKTKIKIICPTHGEFKQTPNAHLVGQGCPKCNLSKGELKIIAFLNKNDIKYINQYQFDNCKNIFKLSFDFYLPELNILIEFDGEQHFRSVKYFGGVNDFDKRKKRDQIKIDFAKNNNIQLIRIKYNENIEKILTTNLLC